MSAGRSFRVRGSSHQLRLALEPQTAGSTIRFGGTMAPPGDQRSGAWEHAGRRMLLWALPGVVVFLLLRQFGSPLTEGVLRHVGGLPVESVVVEGADWVPAGDVVREAGRLRGTELYDVDLVEVSTKLTGDPRIQSARVERKLFHTISVQITERHPLALVASSPVTGVDADGVAFPFPDARGPRDLPFVTGVATGEASISRLRAVVAGLAELQRAHPAVYARVSEVDLSTFPDATVFLVGGGTPVRVGVTEVAALGDRLPPVLERLHTEGKTAAYIDLRFKDRAYVKPRTTTPPGRVAAPVRARKPKTASAKSSKHGKPRTGKAGHRAWGIR